MPRPPREAPQPKPAPLPSPASRTGGPPRKLYKIGEVLRYTEAWARQRDMKPITRQTLHNYTMMGLLSIAERTESGHRLYDESVFATLEKIEMLKRHRKLAEVKEILEKWRAEKAPQS